MSLKFAGFPLLQRDELDVRHAKALASFFPFFLCKRTSANRMFFAISTPSWNSLDSVRRIHSELAAAALLFFALLVLFEVFAHLSNDDTRKALLEKIGLTFFAVAVLAEIVAYPYGQRNDTLSAQIIGSLDAKAQRASDNASRALSASSTAFSQARDAEGTASSAEAKANTAKQAANNLIAELGKADLKLRQLQIFALARHLADPEAFVKALNPLKGRPVLFRSYVGDAEAWLLCTSLWDAARKAEMDATSQCGQWPLDAGGELVRGLHVYGPATEVVLNALVKGRISGGAEGDFGPAPF